MLKRFSIKKISKYTILLLIVFLFYLFPSKNKYSLENTVGKEIKVLGVEYPQTANEIEYLNSFPETAFPSYDSSIDDANLMMSLSGFEW